MDGFGFLELRRLRRRVAAAACSLAVTTTASDSDSAQAVRAFCASVQSVLQVHLPLLSAAAAGIPFACLHKGTTVALRGCRWPSCLRRLHRHTSLLDA